MNWISVNDQMPKCDNTDYLICAPEGVSIATIRDGKFFCYLLREIDDEVTHWAEMVEPPKTKETYIVGSRQSED